MSETNNTKQAAWIALGSLFSFGFGIISGMILSRYFSQTDYGTYRQVFYVYSSLLAVFSLGIPKAYSYFLPRSPLNQSKDLIRKITNILFVLGGFVSLLLFLGAGFVADLLKNPELKTALWIFSPVPFLMMPTLGLEGILATYRKTKFVALYTIATRIISLLCVALPVFFFDIGYKEALIYFDIGCVVSFLIALRLKYYPVRHEQNDKTEEKFSNILKFCLPLMVASLWGVLINSTDQFFISRYFGTETFAIFSNGAMELPFVGMIIGASATVLTPLFTRQVHEHADFKQEIYPIWRSSFEKSAMLIYPITIFCLFDATLVMTVMYGEAYHASGEFFQIKLFTYFFKIISFYSILLALGATRFYERVHLFNFLILAIIEYASILIWNNPLLITAIHVACTIGNCIVFLYYIARRFSVSLWFLFPKLTILKTFIASAIAIGIVLFIRTYQYPQISDFSKLCADIGIFLLAYLTVCIPLKLNYKKLIIPLIKK